jgi:hypothetical protein
MQPARHACAMVTGVVLAGLAMGDSAFHYGQIFGEPHSIRLQQCHCGSTHPLPVSQGCLPICQEPSASGCSRNPGIIVCVFNSNSIQLCD